MKSMVNITIYEPNTLLGFYGHVFWGQVVLE